MSFLQSSKARSARQSLLGIKRIPDDPLAADREILDRGDETLEVFESCVTELELALTRLSRVNDDFAACMVECGLGADLATSDLRWPRQAYASTNAKLGALKMSLRSLISTSDSIRSKLKERDKLYWEKTHYENKISNLSDEDKLDSDRVDRNVKKRSKAITDFAETERDFFHAQDFARSFPNQLSVCASMYADFFEQFFKRQDIPVPSRPGSPASLGSPTVAPPGTSRYPSIS